MKLCPIKEKDDYDIFDFVERKNNNNYYRAVCKKCGHSKVIGFNNIKKQSLFCNYLNCKDDYLTSMVGSSFDDYDIIGVKNGSVVARCRICNHIKTVPSYKLSVASFLHNGSNCGQDYINAVIGQQFGDFIITAIDKDSKRVTKEVYYIARCVVCGIEIKSSLRVLQKLPSHGAPCFKALPNDEYKKAFEWRFNDMKQRCNNPNNDNFEHYGARGIRVEYEHLVDFYLDFIDEFKSFSAIHGIRNTTFDRIDVDGNYCKDNLRLATQNVQSTNTTRRKIFIIEKDGVRIIGDSAMYVAKHLGINGRSLGNLIRGTSKSAGGWKLVGVFNDKENISKLVNDEDVTTNLIMSM